MKEIDPVEICAELIKLDTTTGKEETCLEYIYNILKEYSFKIKVQEFGNGFKNLVAEYGPVNSLKGTLCLSGHIDTVPFDASNWNIPPLEPVIKNGKLYGRGASDMKSGIAAMIVAALLLSEEKDLKSGFKLVLSSAEEIGCLGSKALAEEKTLLGEAGAMLICEPTFNYPCLGHKGALWLELSAKGIAAHASMPEKGVNAIMKAINVIQKLNGFDFGVEAHPVLGMPTFNIGTIAGGRNINSVPDYAVAGIDFRTLPGQSHKGLMERLEGFLEEDVKSKPLISAESIMSDPANEWVREVYGICSRRSGVYPAPRGVTYFTDGSYLMKAFGNIPVIIMGPGEPELAHKNDEYCYVDKIREAAGIYTDIIRKWCL